MKNIFTTLVLILLCSGIASAKPSNPALNTANTTGIPKNAFAAVNYALTMTSTPGPWYVPGGTQVYTITVTNVTGTPTSSPVIVCTLPADVTGTWTASSSGTAFADGTNHTSAGTGNINITTAKIPAGQSIEITCTLSIPETKSGDLSVTATVSPGSTDTDIRESNDSKTISKTQAPPYLTSFAPTSGVKGNTVTLTGTYLLGTSSVTFNGVEATSFTVNSSTSITAVAPAGTTGPIKVITGGGPTTSVTNFTYLLPPTISSVSPASGPVGSSVIINGTGFNGSFVTNVVYFGGVAANIIAAGATRLTVTVPAGTTNTPISVLNTVSRMAAESQLPFVTTFTPVKPRLGNDDFAQRTSLGTSSSTSSLIFADLNGDGKTELIAGGISAINVYKNTATVGTVDASSFSSTVQNFAVTEVPRTILTIDIDGDGKLDLVSAGSNIVSVLRNTSTGGLISFDAAVKFNMGPTSTFNTFSITSGDLDGDGKPDLVIGNAASTATDILILKNSATVGVVDANSFEPLITIATGANSYGSIKVIDLDGDGKLDIALARPIQDILLLRNNIAGGSIATASFQTYAIPFVTTNGSIAFADLDNDGKPDLIASHQTQLNTYRNNFVQGASFTASSFGAPIVNTVSSNAFTITPSDLNGDGKIDLVTTDSFAQSARLYRNTTTSAISLAADAILSPNQSVSGAGIADIDGNGKADVVLSGSTNLFIFRNNPILAPTVQAKTINFISTTSTKSTISWTNGNGVGRIVFVKIGNTGTAAPDDNTYYNPNVIYGSGDQIGTSGWYAVYNGTGSSVTVTGLKELTDYQVMVLDYNGTPSSEQYLSTTETGNPATLSTTVTVVPVTQAANVTASVSYTSATLGWTNGSGEKRAVFMFLGNSGSPVPEDHISYTSNTVFGTGTQIGTSGWYCVYNGTGSAVNVTGLSTNSTYQIMVVEYNGNPGDEVFLKTTAVNNPITLNTLLVPVITAFTPLSGAAGTTVTISGKSFNAVAANNIVFFGGAKAVVTGGNETSLTVTVPLGATYDFVTVTDGVGKLTAQSRLQFKPTFAGKGGMAAGDFENKVTLTTGNAPTAVAMGDLNGDGKLDLVVTNNLSNSVFIYKNTSGIGSFSAANFVKQDLTTTLTTPKNVLIKDLDGDGKPELIVSTAPAATSIFPNTSPDGTGEISFGTPIQIANGGFYQNAIKVGDIDGDGKPDIIATSSANNYRLFRNTTTTNLAFGTPATLSGGEFVNNELVDLNGDGKLDLVMLMYSPNSTSIFKNQATGGVAFTTNSFAARTMTSNNIGSPLALAVGDLDDDGLPDFVVGSQSSSNYSISRNTVPIGATSFTGFVNNVITKTAGLIASTLAMGDLDGDGKVDILAAYSNSTNTGAAINTTTVGPLAILKNTTTPGVFTAGSFAAPFMLDAAAQISGLAVGDLDGDGKPDIALVNRATGGGLILYRNNPFLAPTTQASEVIVANLTQNTANLSWTNGNGTSRTVFVKAAITGTASPVNGTDYVGNAAFASGTQIETTGWYAVYSGTANSVAVTGLSGNTSYQVMVLEYNGTAATAAYQTASASDNPINFTTPSIQISNFSPTAAAAGETVTITGTNFTGATSVTFGGATASFNVVSDTQITAVVPAGSTSGIVEVTGPNGTAGLAGFTFNVPTIVAGAVSGTLSACLGAAGVDPNLQQFSVSATYLSANLNLAAPAGFEISLTATTNFGNTLSLLPQSGTVAATVIYVRAAIPTTAGAISGNVVLSSSNATSINIAVNGTIYAIPTANAIANVVITNGDAHPFTFTGTGADTFTWENDNGDIGLPAGTGQGDIGPGVFYENNTNDPIVAHLTVTPSNSVSGCTGTPVAFTITVMPTPTNVVSIARTGTALSNATSGGYMVTFADVVSGLSASNFSIATGGLSASSVSSVSGSGKTYTVTVNTGTGSGTLGLNLANVTGLSRSVTNALPFIGELYTLDRTAPDAPINLLATSGNTQIVLSWLANTESDLSGYKIYYGTSSEPTTLLASVNAPTLTYTHTGLTNGIIYYYRITAVDALGNESAYSIEDSTVPRAGQSISFSALANKFFGDADFDPAATSATSGINPIDYTSSNINVATIVNGNVHIVGVGTTNITAKQAGNNEYRAAADVVQALQVLQQAQSITFSALPDKTFGEADFSLSAFGGPSGNAITYTSSNPLVATVTGNVVSIVGAGTSTITASQAGNVNYGAATAISQSLSVNKATATITLTDLSQTFDGSAKVVTVLTTPAGLTGISVSYDGSATAPAAAGNYAVIASLTNNNYQATPATGTFIIGANIQTIVWNNPANIVYGTPLSSTQLNATAQGTLSYTPALGTILNAGTNTLSVTADATANYDANTKSVSIQVDQAPATIILSTLAQTYDGAAKAITATTLPAGLNGVSITYDGSTTIPINAGTYAVVASLNNLNYQATPATGTLIISKAAQVVVWNNPANIFYGTPLSATQLNATAVGTLTYSPALGTLLNAGQYTLSVAAAGTANYEAASLTVSITVDPAAASLTLSSLSQTYDGTAKSVAVNTTPTGLTGVSITYDGSATVPTNVGTYAVIASLSNNNYQAMPVNGTLTIQNTPQTIVWNNPSNIVYGTALSATQLNATAPGALTYAPAAGTILTAGVNTLSVTAAATANYSGASKTVSIQVDQAVATILLSNLNQTYDGTAKAVTATTTPLGLSGLSITYDGSTTVPTQAGTYSVVASLSNLNYLAAPVSGTLTIGKANQVVVWNAPANIVFGTALTAMQLNATAPGALSYTPAVGAMLPAGANTLSVNAAATANYFAAVKTVSIQVDQALATISLSNLAQAFDGTPKPVTASTAPANLSGIAITYNGLVTAPSAAGTYAVVASLSNANYTAANATGTLTIGSLTQSISFAPFGTTTYGDAPIVLSAIGGGSGNPVTYSSSNPAVASISGNTLTILSAGAVNITASQAGSLTYSAAANVTQNLTIAKAAPVISWNKPLAITYGTLLSATQLSATASVSGTFVYSPAAGAKLNAGLAQNLKVDFTPSDLTNYTVQSKTVSIDVNKAILQVTAENKQRCLGAANPALTLAYSGFVAGDNTASITPPVASSAAGNQSAAGNYTIALTGGAAANYTLSLINGTLTVNALPIPAITSNKGNAVGKGESIQLTATGGTSYAWATNSSILSGQNTAILTVRPSVTTTYTVTASNASGCSENTSYTIAVESDYSKLKSTNLLTPNNDGINDKWIITNIDLYGNNEAKVFDVAGRLVYSKKNYDNSWEGTFNGAPLSEGTYYYVVDFGSGKGKLKGFVTIVRE